MDPAEYEQINAEIAEVIAGISPIERIYHLNKVGLKFMELLDDYNWSCTYTSSTTAEVRAGFAKIYNELYLFSKIYKVRKRTLCRTMSDDINMK